jgi:lipopolysaccharide export system permease protein
MKIIQRHLIRNFVPPFLFGLSVTTFILMIEVLERYFNLFLEKGVEFAVATQVLVLSLGHTFALSIPMAVLVGVLMGVGQLAADREITALKASGVSLYQICLPLLVVGLLLSGAMMAYNHWILPESNHKLRTLLLRIHEQRPMLEIHANTLTKINDEYSIFVREKDDRTGELRQVKLYQRDGRGDPVPDAIVARTGRLRSVALGRIQLDLYDGEFHRVPDPDDPATYNKTNFNRQTVTIDLDPRGGQARPHARGEREMNVQMLHDAVVDQQQQQAQARADAAELVERTMRPALQPLLEMEHFEQASVSGGAEQYRSMLSRLERNAKALDMKATLIENHRIRANRYEVELQKKFSIPVACTVFVLLGVPLAVFSRRGGKGVSAGTSLLAFTVYYLFLTGGEKLADRGLLSAWISMWAANLVLGGTGLFLLYQSVQEVKTLRWKWWNKKTSAGPVA